MNNDLIRRQDAFDAMTSARFHITGMRIGKVILKEYGNQCRDILLSAVQNVEPADAEYVRHGSWIVVGKTEGGSNILKCSCCKRIRKGISKSAYCRDCGAKMDLEEVSV